MNNINIFIYYFLFYTSYIIFNMFLIYYSNKYNIDMKLDKFNV